MCKVNAINIISAVVILLAACSCDKSEFTINDGNRSLRPILISDVEVGYPVFLKGGEPESHRVGVVDDGDVSFSVYETVSCIDSDYRTKATATTTDNLGDFTVYGYLDPENKLKPGASDDDKNNLYFMPGATAQKEKIENDYWWGDLNSDYNWRYGAHHHFWATPNSLTDFSIDQDGFDSASFSYTSNGTGDAGFWPRGSSTPRCEVVQYEVKGLQDKGNCAVDSTNAFTWSNLSSTKNPASIDLLENNNNNEPKFVIPQGRGSLIRIQILDRQRDLSLPFIYEAPVVFGSGLWQAGHQYNYTLQGKVIVPDQGDKAGIDAGFSGKPFQSLCVISNLNIKYIKKVRLSWNNSLELSGATGTNAAIGWEYGSAEPRETEYKSGNSFNTGNSKIVWAFKDAEVVKGNPLGPVTPSGTLKYDFSCSAVIDMTDLNYLTYNNISLWCSYMGSDGGHAGIKWIMTDMKCEIIEWR